MSGGSMNYIYSKLASDANFRQDTPERKAFAKHLNLICKALHDIEWVDSGDYSRGDETEAITACLSDASVLMEAIAMAELARETLSLWIDKARKA